MKTSYDECWPICHTQADAGLPDGPLQPPTLLRWQHWLAFGVGLGLIIGGLLS